VKAPLHQVSVDWFRLIWDLVQRGHNLAIIERTTGISSSTLRGYLDGSQPPHWRGELLIGMWCRHVDLERDDLPMVDVVLSPRVVQPPPAVRENDATALEQWMRQPLLERLKKGAKR
jgi:hypothetical protein